MLDSKTYLANAASNGYPYIPEQNCYIYISHLDEEHQVWLLPSTPESINDTMQSSFQETNALGRSAPVYTYSNSGPRQVQINLQLHRDMMDLANLNKVVPIWDSKTDPQQNRYLDEMNKYQQALESDRDTTDQLIRALQSIALPKYNLDNLAVEPPLVAVRLSKEVFIKGVVSGSIGVEYSLPILSNGKYAQVKITFTVSEVDPYDATTVFTNGSFRGVMQTIGSRMGLDADGGTT